MHSTLPTSPSARYYNSDLSIWISVDPLADKYPNLSPYTYCADNPVRLVDPDGRTIVGTDGKDVSYSIDEKGTVTWSKNASVDTKKIGNELLKTETGKQQLDKLVNSETKITLNISKKDKNENNNVTFGSFFYDKSDKNIYTDENGNIHIKTGTIVIYEGSISSYLGASGSINILNDKPSAMLVGASNVTPIEYMAAVAGHEIEHATSLTNIQLHYWGDKSAAEIMPNIIKENILWEYFFPY